MVHRWRHLPLVDHLCRGRVFPCTGSDEEGIAAVGLSQGTSQRQPLQDDLVEDRRELSWLMDCHSGWYPEDRGCNLSRHIRISIWRTRSTTEGRMAMLWMVMHRLRRVRSVFLSDRSPIFRFWPPSFLRPPKPSTAPDLHSSATDLLRQSTTAIPKMLQTTCLLTELRK